MKIELTPANSKTLTEYAALAGHTPTEFLNQYSRKTWSPYSRTPKAVPLRVTTGKLRSKQNPAKTKEFAGSRQPQVENSDARCKLAGYRTNHPFANPNKDKRL
jgi:hypothetical protein